MLCTTQQAADLVKNVGGKHVRVEALFGPGVDPHTYRASTKDTRLLEQAELIVYNGLHLEGKMAEMLGKMSSMKPTLSLGDTIAGVAPEKMRHPPEFTDGIDPHLWFDVELWSLSIPPLVQKLGELRPAFKEEFAQQGQAYAAELGKLHAECKATLAAIPREQRILVTAHDAFGYFGAAYDVEVRGLQGISTASDVSIQHVNELVKLLVERKIKAIFVESSVAPENFRNVIAGCAAEGHTVVVGGELFSDAMGPADTPEGTYAGMIRHNLRLISTALK
ncbi:MAG: zinc ABC transporter substrate-binding protein [Pirellulales bacterium]|nr:zinc ABC transporter substrate-binding protein [Pirellulales bacterium]